MSGERYIKRSHKTFCVGVSLGAHVCGFMGTYGNELLGDGTKALDRIIALDPAGMYSDWFCDEIPDTANVTRGHCYLSEHLYSHFFTF